MACSSGAESSKQKAYLQGFYGRFGSAAHQRLVDLLISV
jgi:hypothetical protein